MKDIIGQMVQIHIIMIRGKNMMEIKEQIKFKLLQYLSKEITKENLIEWALEVLHKMLKGNILNIKYLELYSVITKIIEVEDLNDSCGNKMLYHLLKVLSGEKSDSFIFSMQIPKKFIVNNLKECKKIIRKYYEKRCLKEVEIQELRQITQKETNAIVTLNEFIELQIIDLLKLGYEFREDENSVQFELKSTVFIKEDMYLEDDLLLKIISLLECYEGEKSFYVHINFNCGIGNISIQV